MLSYPTRSPGLLSAWHRRDRSATIAYLPRLRRLTSPEIVASIRLHARSRGIVGAPMTGFPSYGRFSQRPRQKASASYEGRTRRPTVAPAQHFLMYLLSKVDMDHPARGSHREEAKRGPPSGHRIPRNAAAMMSLLLPYAPTGLSRSAGWGVIRATPLGQPRTPAMLLLHGCEGLRVQRMTGGGHSARPLWVATCAMHDCATRCLISPS
jgi:hypothetical protein